MSDEFDDIDEQLESLNEREQELTQKCMYRSSRRVAEEICRTARQHRRVIPYLYAKFTVMNQSIDLLEPEVTKDAAIELISLLESEDRARSIQPDLPEADYANTVGWMSSCAYDNLAKATAQLAGYNSEGTHACIADGIEVCRRTGKLECIRCFHEYAADVYRAADDLDMATHYARGGLSRDSIPGRHDRNWLAGRDLCKIQLMNGQLTQAANSLLEAEAFISSWHTPFSASIQTRDMMRRISHLLGEPDRFKNVLDADEDQSKLPGDEFPGYEFDVAVTDAIVACCQGDIEQAIEILTEWDRKLGRARCLDLWFAARLQLLATYHLAGKTRELNRLAEPLREKATEARDWLTLRCLQRFQDPNTVPAPIATLGNLDAGPFASKSASTHHATAAGPNGEDLVPSVATEDSGSVVSDTDADAQEEDAASKEPPASIAPLMSQVREIPEQESEEEALQLAQGILDQVLERDPAQQSLKEAQWCLHLLRHVCGDGEHFTKIWMWAQTVTATQPEDAVLISLHASLAASLLFGDESETMAEIIDADWIERQLRKSLDLDPDKPRNYKRAADFFLHTDNLGEAERCLARAFRLDRTDEDAAYELANLYRRTERERDALGVLDMVLRSGSESPGVAWNAAMIAHQVEQYEATLLYLDAFEKNVKDELWANYYRSSALIALGRSDEALPHLEKEAELNPEAHYPLTLLKTAASISTHKFEDASSLLNELEQLKLYEVEAFSLTGLASLFERLVVAGTRESEQIPVALLTRLEDLVLRSCMAPDALFDNARGSRQYTEFVNFYECHLRQPLDERWAECPARLIYEDEVSVAYDVIWGVLAEDEEQAANFALSFQRRCFPLEPEVVSVSMEDSGYREQVGVVWHSRRRCFTAGELDEELEYLDDE